MVAREKITHYLLSLAHEEGRSKANFFLRFGFTADMWETFALALRRHAATHEVARILDSPYGTRYVIEGMLEAPDGRTPEVRSVWFIEFGTSIPRLVTAYPL